MLRSTFTRWLVPALLLTVLVAAACGGDDDDEGDSPDPTAPATTSVATEDPASTPATGETPGATAAGTPANRPPGPGAGDTTILVGDGGALGQILTTSEGLTLYTFANDEVGSGASACEGACANAWPPLLVQGEPNAPDGVSGELATITRTDGATQVTYNGRPLYRFINDTAPGQTNGHNVAGVWFVATP